MFFLVACTHIVKRPSQCASPPEPPGHSAVGWQRVAGIARVSGKVLAPGSFVPIHAATVNLTLLQITAQGASRSLQAVTDVAGEFQIDSTPPGHYLMRIRRLGYQPAHDTIRVTLDSAVVVTGLLVPDNMILDDCSLTYQEVRVPWWKR
jgi:hypothetical protein